MRSLTHRQKRFVHFYTTPGQPGFGVATRAARLAGYPWPDKQGSRLTRMPAVAAALREADEIQDAAWLLQMDYRQRECIIRVSPKFARAWERATAPRPA